MKISKKIYARNFMKMIFNGCPEWIELLIKNTNKLMWNRMMMAEDDDELLWNMIMMNDDDK